MPISLRRALLCLTLFAILIASIIVPVLIVLGLSERWLLFFPYALFVGALIVLIAQSDRSERPVPTARPTLREFLSTHLLLVAVGTVHVFLLVYEWFGVKGDSGWWPELAVLVFLAVGAAKWLLSRIPALSIRPLWYESVVDAVVLATLFASIIKVTLR
ncbi:MAG TPA: hypothetical protein DCR44_00725 [Acholeplasmatales bacterium]|nr:MAG: hypothetical protein A2Y16_06870 [Tenericutes bacterium GWF2_57_13]HAQ55923.1 hypothetical protein [Acholeplasmatales bacterium]